MVTDPLDGLTVLERGWLSSNNLLIHPAAGEPGAVLCDGLGCDGFVWKYLQPYLQQSHRVLRWHYRGHGRSGLPRHRDRNCRR